MTNTTRARREALNCKLCGSEAKSFGDFWRCSDQEKCATFGPNNDADAAKWNRLMAPDAPRSLPAKVPEGHVRATVTALVCTNGEWAAYAAPGLSASQAFGCIVETVSDKAYNSGYRIATITADIPLPKPVKVVGEVG